MTESNDYQAPVTVPPLAPPPAPTPTVSAEANEVAFHEQVKVQRGHSVAVRAGIVAGSALLVLVGVVAAMGASPSPSADPSLVTGADPSSDPSTAPAPASSAAPDTKAPDGTKHDHRGGPDGFGFRGGPGFGMGFHDITITSIDGSSLALATEDGWTRTIEVTDTTTITKGGATITLADLAVGDEIQFRQERATDGTFTVTAIVVVLPHVIGEISAIDGSTITVTQPGGTTATIHVDSDTTYKIAGAAGSLSDLKVGAVIVAQGTQRADGSLDADVVGSGPRDGLKDGGGHHGIPDGLGGPDQDPAASPAPSSGAS